MAVYACIYVGAYGYTYIAMATYTLPYMVSAPGLRIVE
mgnify:CR=1 FL=1